VKVAITGASGLIGRALADDLLSSDHDVVKVSREADGSFRTAQLESADAVVHLAGEPIGGKLRWNEEHKRKVRRSRVEGTRQVAEALARQATHPRVLVSASAVGYYGSNRGDEILDEHAGSGNGFLSELCVAWEAATGAASDAGIRVVRIRTGIVLHPAGGVLPKLLLPGRLGLGAKLGSGRQWLSWISLDDQIRAIRRAIDDDRLSGPVNLAAPHPVTNAELTRTIGRVFGRPAVLAAPEPVLNLVLGSETVKETLLASQRVEPAALIRAGFIFEEPELEPALRSMLGR
jgi:uncharacterized protein